MRDGPLGTTLKAAMAETEEIIYSVVGDLLEKTGIDAREVWAALLARLRMQNPILQSHGPTMHTHPSAIDISIVDMSLTDISIKWELLPIANVCS